MAKRRTPYVSSKLMNTYKPAAKKDLADLKDFAAQSGFKDEIMPWDVSYYSEKLKEKLFAFSSEDLRPYFPLEPVLKGTFEHFSKLFGITFTPAKYPVWHEDVVSYDVTDTKTGEFMDCSMPISTRARARNRAHG